MSDSNLTDALNGHLKPRQAEKYPFVRTQAQGIEQLARSWAGIVTVELVEQGG